MVLPTTITEARGSFITNYQERLNYDRTLTPTLLLHIGAGLYHQSFVDNSPETHLQSADPPGAERLPGESQFPAIHWKLHGGPARHCTNATGGMTNLGTARPGSQLRNEAHRHHQPDLGSRQAHLQGRRGDGSMNRLIRSPIPRLLSIPATAATRIPSRLPIAMAALAPASASPASCWATISAIIAGRADRYPRIATFDWAFFLQDSWKVTRKLTLDYGVRWDYDTPAHEQYNRWGQIDPTAGEPQCRWPSGELSVRQHARCHFYKSAYPYAIGPRLGVAYQINPKTVFRGGWGVNYQFVSGSRRWDR